MPQFKKRNVSATNERKMALFLLGLQSAQECPEQRSVKYSVALGSLTIDLLKDGLC